MKIKNILAVGAAVVLTGLSAFGQGRGLDAWSLTRTFVIAPPTNIIGGTAAPYAGPLTNWPTDLRGMDGYSQLIVFASTNIGTAGGTMTVTPQTSADTTNWTTLTNFACVTSNTTAVVTNTFYLGTPIETNQLLFPFTITTPTITPVYESWVTKYNQPFPYTNGAAITVSNNGYSTYGFQVGDAQRYFRLIFTPGGTVTNWTVGATLITFPRQQ